MKQQKANKIKKKIDY